MPLVFTVLELSSRFPEEGGLYSWTRRAFGEFPGYLSGYLYWSSNLPYFPSLFYFTAANALFIFGHRFDALQNNQPYFIIFSLLALAVAVGLNIAGLNIGKWLHNLGALGLWIPAIVLVGMGVALRSVVRIGDVVHRAIVRAEHASQGHHLLVDDRVLVERARERIDARR